MTMIAMKRTVIEEYYDDYEDYYDGEEDLHGKLNKEDMIEFVESELWMKIMWWCGCAYIWCCM